MCTQLWRDSSLWMMEKYRRMLFTVSRKSESAVIGTHWERGMKLSGTLYMGENLEGEGTRDEKGSFGRWGGGGGVQR